MAYTLTLTCEERAAFDWVGHRYDSTGDAMAGLLCEGMPADAEWSQPGDITFRVPEHVAWAMSDLAEADGYLWPCFGGTLAAKLNAFLERIV